MTPSAACWHPDPPPNGTAVAIYAAGSPDEAAQVAAFDRDHPHGQDGHQRVERLPERRGKGDVQWGAK